MLSWGSSKENMGESFSAPLWISAFVMEGILAAQTRNKIGNNVIWESVTSMCAGSTLANVKIGNSLHRTESAEMADALASEAHSTDHGIAIQRHG